MTKSVLHICSYYSRKSIYRDLMAKMAGLGFKQVLFTAIRTKLDIDQYRILDNDDFEFHYALVLKPFHRLFYYMKIKRVFKELENRVYLPEIQLCHAHTLFSDGGLALELKRKYGIPYIVAVRNTDINIFFKYMIHLRPKCTEILKNASKVVFINYDQKKHLLEKYKDSDFLASVSEKSTIIPNGVDEFWHENHGSVKRIKDQQKLNLLYVGNFTSNKNVPLVINAARCYAMKMPDTMVNLNLIGGGGISGRGEGDSSIDKSIDACKNLINLTINVIGKISDLSTLKDFYSEADIFIMTSKKETFGLVYVEALTQGTPIIYTSKQGISSFFKQGEVGYGIDVFTEDAIVEKIEMIIDRYPEISKRCILRSREFNWNQIAKIYQSDYENAMLDRARRKIERKFTQ